ncbi:putative inactive cadmium/zinc-transporting ATPase HMA3 [Impatiens glandulifera]|uniref:putative inactive cadmium/zinc-transporting ATPase HMA3 n=1 Tax=Impatiens glandulifera TaxID=253017 RepID=UPI001FB1309D|nr:putative inactive cadmium/zinc-transporting ATPase HMA3 [Impatiens glandulifera]XP_047337656.1 putative inactive cadmium/zinc-transporting ATPase HMA3 [Impatiens glandulifera]
MVKNGTGSDELREIIKKEIDGDQNKKKFTKSYFDVVGLCCTSEVPLVEKILMSLDGIKDFSIIVPSKTLIVIHDDLVLSQLQIVKALNHARLEANVRTYGESNHKKKWPSVYAMLSGVLLLLSFLKYVYSPLQWLAIGSVAVGIGPILLRSLTAIRNLTLDTNILVLIAVAGSIALKDYWEAASIVFLFSIAQWLEARASHKASATMTSLMNVVPRRAVLAETGEEVDANKVEVGTIVAVKAGTNIPIDGTVVEGKCEVDEKTLTGESFPVTKEIDSIVWAGTINLTGYISVKTTSLSEDSVVARMAKLVEEAQNSKSQTQRFIDKCAKYYTPAIVLLSAGLAVIPAALNVHNKTEWFHLALVVLVSACPCALILSTPVATFCALSKAATSGLLIKGGEYIEKLSKIKVVAFDKTGTITRGEFEVKNFQSLHDYFPINTLLYWVSCIESKSSHPMAAALVDYGRTHSVEPKPELVEGFQDFPGEGVFGKIEGNEIYIGNRKISIRAGCSSVPDMDPELMEGKTVGYIFIGETAVGIFSLSDTCRTGAYEAILELKSMGIKSVMLTGDNNGAANQIQTQLKGALDAIHAELLPQDKANIIKKLQTEAPTAMVGDGINDALALAEADIGISMGISGSALASETGQVILMSNDIRKIPEAVKLARKAYRKVIENVIISISTKGAILALAIAGHPLVWAAVLTDVGTCLLVIFNSMLLLRGGHKPKHAHKHKKSHCGSTASHGHNHNEQKRNCCSKPEPAHSSLVGHNHEEKHNCCSKPEPTHSSLVVDNHHHHEKNNCCSKPKPTHSSLDVHHHHEEKHNCCPKPEPSHSILVVDNHHHHEKNNCCSKPKPTHSSLDVHHHHEEKHNCCPKPEPSHSILVVDNHHHHEKNNCCSKPKPTHSSLDVHHHHEEKNNCCPKPEPAHSSLVVDNHPHHGKNNCCSKPKPTHSSLDVHHHHEEKHNCCPKPEPVHSSLVDNHNWDITGIDEEAPEHNEHKCCTQEHHMIDPHVDISRPDEGPCCGSLEIKRTSGCCESFRKECCGKKGNMGLSLSEIVIE